MFCLGPVPDRRGAALKVRITAEEAMLFVCVGLTYVVSSRKALRDNAYTLSLIDYLFSSEETKKEI